MPATGRGFLLPPILLDPARIFLEEPDFPTVNDESMGIAK